MKHICLRCGYDYLDEDSNNHRCPFCGEEENNLGEDIKEVIKEVKRLKEEKTDQGYYYYGCLYLLGYFGEPDNKKAMDLFVKLSKKGHVGAAISAGECYLEENDLGQAMKYLIIGKEANHPRAYCDLTLCYDEDKNIRYLYEEAAKLGSLEAEHAIAKAYQDGTFYEVNLEKAFQLFKKGAEKGYIPSREKLGRCYLAGAGCPRDDEEGFKQLKICSDFGFPPAKMALSVCYLQGIGTKVNQEEGFLLAQEAANEGEALAVYQLAICYYQGLGTPVNLEQALKLFKAAFILGIKEAGDVAEQLEKLTETPKKHKA